jgi:hypothetical protein
MMLGMRTTLTIDDDLLDRLRQEAARTRRPVRELLNERLRVGLTAAARRRGSRPFVVKPFAAAGGFAPGVDELKLNQLADELEAEAVHR